MEMVQLQWNFASAKEILHILHLLLVFSLDLLEQSRLQMPFCTSKEFFTEGS
jgi:hypothetical protein